MHRRDFFKMLGIGASVTAAGLLVPEPVKSYFFFTQRTVNIRFIKCFDMLTGRWIERIDSSFMELDLPAGMECAFRVSVPETQYETGIDFLTSMGRKHNFNLQVMADAMKSSGVPNKQSISTICGYT